MADNRSLILSDLVAEYDFVVDDLSVWEIVNPSSEEGGNSDADFSFSDNEAEVEAVAEAESKESAADAVKEEAPMEVGSPSSDVSMKESLSAQVNQLIDDGDGNANGNGVASEIITSVDAAVDCNGGVGGDVFDDSYAYNYHREHNFYDSYAEYSEYSDAWDLSNLGRNKNKKWGKKASSKMNRAKKLPCRYTKRCVYGKDGFGAQLSYI